MNRRPWPILVLAILQFISPLIYLLFAAGFYHLSIGAAYREIRALSTDLRQFELFVLPLILGALILVVRRFGYVVVIVGSVYLMVRSIVEYSASNQTDPVFPVVLTNLLCAAVLLYFMRKRTREIYFNPRMRWWETDPRYVVDFPGTLARLGAQPVKARVKNVAKGGAGLTTAAASFLPSEVLDVAFTHENQTYSRKARVVWQKPQGDETYVGIQWVQDDAPAERSKIRRLVRTLKAKGAATTRT
jgi:hypothetical protein